MTTFKQRVDEARKASGVHYNEEEYGIGYADGFDAGCERGLSWASVEAEKSREAMLRLVQMLAPHVSINATIQAQSASKQCAARPGKKGAGKG